MSLDKILEKIAISNELKNKAYVERAARLHRAREVATAGTKVIYDMGRVPNKQQLFENAKQYMNVKGPEENRVPTGAESHRNVQKRYMQLIKNPTEDITRLHNPSDSLAAHVSKVKKMKTLKNVGKGALLAGGLAGAAYGGKKLYDKMTEKTAFAPNPGILSKIKSVAKSNAVPALENLGLGVLAVPSAQTMLDPNANEHDKSHAKYELGGLGILAAHPTYELGHAAYQGLKGAPQNAAQGGLLGRTMGALKQHVPQMGENIMNKIKFIR